MPGRPINPAPGSIEPTADTTDLSWIVAPADNDYVDTFRRTAMLNRLIRRRGPTPLRLLRRCILYQALGDHAQSAEDAAKMLRLEPGNEEGIFRLGTACLAMAIQQQGELPAGPGAPLQGPHWEPQELLLTAQAAFEQILRSNPADAEAEQALQETRKRLAWMMGPHPARPLRPIMSRMRGGTTNRTEYRGEIRFYSP